MYTISLNRHGLYMYYTPLEIDVVIRLNKLESNFTKKCLMRRLVEIGLVVYI